MAGKIEAANTIQECLDFGISKEELEKHLLKRQMTNRSVEQLVHDFLYGEIQAYKYYGDLTGISNTRVYQHITGINRKAKWLVNASKKVLIKGAEKKGKSHILDFYSDHGPLDTRTVNALMRYGIMLPEQLYELNPNDYWKIRNLGKRCIERVEEFKIMYKEIVLGE